MVQQSARRLIEPATTWWPRGSRRRYGPQRESSAAIRMLASEIATLVERHEGTEMPRRVAEALRRTLVAPRLLAPRHRRGAPDTYRRHLLYTDPYGRFSILALVWGPGQRTPVHGHTAWGCVGVHEGELTISQFTLTAGTADAFCCRRTATILARAGDTGFVRPGLADIHRIANDAQRSAISIHVYGRDLSRDPDSLNILLPD